MLGGWVPFTVGADASVVTPRSVVRVYWSAPPGHSDQDWIGLYAVGDPGTMSFSRINPNSSTTGRWDFKLPTEPGQYEFRYYTANGSLVATGNRITVLAP